MEQTWAGETGRRGQFASERRIDLSTLGLVRVARPGLLWSQVNALRRRVIKESHTVFVCRQTPYSRLSSSFRGTKKCKWGGWGRGGGGLKNEGDSRIYVERNSFNRPIHQTMACRHGRWTLLHNGGCPRPGWSAGECITQIACRSNRDTHMRISNAQKFYFFLSPFHLKTAGP